MWELQKKLFSKDKIVSETNRWDMIALLLMLTIIFGFAWVAKGMNAPYHPGDVITISLSSKALPRYALRTVGRMFIALFFSLLATFIFGYWAAKSKHAERIIIPLVDILQSVPVLAFLSVTITGFIALFPGSLLGPECAAIFAIFCGQAWNMILGFYQAMITLPADLSEAAAMLQLSAWQRFWRIEVPFAMPSLLWNSMMSMSGGWFFVVLSEAITVNNQTITLPGIGSYIATAIKQADKTAVLYAIVAMLIVILLYDQLLFRPMTAWSEKFKAKQEETEDVDTPWLTRLLQRTKLLRIFGRLMTWLGDFIINLSLFNNKNRRTYKSKTITIRFVFIILFYLFLFITLFSVTIILGRFIYHAVGYQEIIHVFILGGYTALRVISLIILCSLFWVPIGVAIGLRPKLAKFIQPIVQFLAAFPATLLFPVVTIFIMTYHLNVEIWVTPLMILGTQWYILFNVIAGTIALPKELSFAAANAGVRGWLWWRRLILPAIFPYYITGAMTAAGGAWNASIVAEVVTWGSVTLRATGLGEYISHYTAIADYPRIALGIFAMCLLVLFINRVIWRPLYHLAERRYQLEG